MPMCRTVRGALSDECRAPIDFAPCERSKRWRELPMGLGTAVA